jgi:hypothetical protein
MQRFEELAQQGLATALGGAGFDFASWQDPTSRKRFLHAYGRQQVWGPLMVKGQRHTPAGTVELVMSSECSHSCEFPCHSSLHHIIQLHRGAVASALGNGNPSQLRHRVCQDTCGFRDWQCRHGHKVRLIAKCPWHLHMQNICAACLEALCWPPNPGRCLVTRHELSMVLHGTPPFPSHSSKQRATARRVMLSWPPHVQREGMRSCNVLYRPVWLVGGKCRCAVALRTCRVKSAAFANSWVQHMSC